MGKKRRDTPEWQWEQALIDTWQHHRWQEVFDELHAQLHRWECGELGDLDMDAAVYAAHKETQVVYGSLCIRSKRDDLILYAQFDDAWFQPWLAQHPPPPGITLAPVTEIRASFPVPGADVRDGHENRRD